MGESTGIGAAGVRTSTQKPSQLSLFGKVLLPLLSFHIFATIPLDFLVWATSCHILPRHATTGPLLAGWVSIKWRGLTTHLHHKQGWISIKWRGLTPHLHHITLLLCGREQKNWSSRGQNQYSEAISALTLSAKFYFLYYPFRSLLPSLLTSWFGQPPATSCHDMPRLGPFCILPEPVSCLSVLFFNRMILRRSDIASYGRQFWFHPLLYSIVRP